MEVAKEPLGYLFDDIVYYDVEQIDSLINSMEYEQAFYFITKAIEKTHSLGLFSMVESEILSRSIRIFTKKNSIDGEKQKN